MFPIRELAGMEQVVAVQAEDQRFPVPGCHQLLPCRFSASDILHFPHVMNLQRPAGCLTVFALARVQSSAKFRSTECERQSIGRDIHFRLVGYPWFEALELEDSDESRLFLSLHGKDQSLFGFEPFDDLFVLVLCLFAKVLSRLRFQMEWNLLMCVLTLKARA
jgi:hypothetical protein